jgi:hypothetical protein
MIGRSSDAVCGLHRAQGDEEHEFLDLASKPRLTVCQWIFQFRSQGRKLRFGDLDLKITMMVS